MTPLFEILGIALKMVDRLVGFFLSTVVHYLGLIILFGYFFYIRGAKVCRESLVSHGSRGTHVGS